jgi:hypothetical protein
MDKQEGRSGIPDATKWRLSQAVNLFMKEPKDFGRFLELWDAGEVDGALAIVSLEKEHLEDLRTILETTETEPGDPRFWSPPFEE